MHSPELTEGPFTAVCLRGRLPPLARSQRLSGLSPSAGPAPSRDHFPPLTALSWSRLRTTDSPEPRFHSDSQGDVGERLRILYATFLSL